MLDILININVKDIAQIIATSYILAIYIGMLFHCCIVHTCAGTVPVVISNGLRTAAARRYA